MRRLAVIAPLALLSTGASPPSGFVTGAPMPDFGSRPGRSLTSPAPPGYDVAPTPNQDASAPMTRASRDASFGPGLFNRSNQYRGEGISPNSSAQIEEERRVKPGAGIKLNVPLN